MTQRKGGHIGEEPHASGTRCEVGDEREGVEEPPLVRMVLNANEIEPGFVRELDLFDYRRIVIGIRCGEVSELDVPSVVNQGTAFFLPAAGHER